MAKIVHSCASEERRFEVVEHPERKAAKGKRAQKVERSIQDSPLDECQALERRQLDKVRTKNRCVPNAKGTETHRK